MTNFSWAELLFIDIFCALYGKDKRNYLEKHHNIPFLDSEGKQRLHDFVIVTKDHKIAIEIEGEAYHNPEFAGESKFSDDLLRANSQIIGGWTRISFTPRNLSENVEIVKKQLNTLLGQDLELVDYDENLNIGKVKAVRKPKHEQSYLREELAQVPYPEEKIDKRIDTEEAEKFLPGVTALAEKYYWPCKDGSAYGDHILNYIVFTCLVEKIWPLVHKYSVLKEQHYIDGFTENLRQDIGGSFIEIIQTLKKLDFKNINIEELFNQMKKIVQDLSNSFEKSPAILKRVATAAIYVQDHISMSKIIDLDNDKDREEIDEVSYMNWVAFLNYGYYVLRMVLQFLSYKLGNPRNAIIGVSSSEKSFCFTLLDKSLCDEISSLVFLTATYYQNHMPAICYLIKLDGSKVRSLLMDDNKLAVRNAFELPCTSEALHSYIEDTSQAVFNTAIVNRYYVEKKPCEFIINAYGVRSLTLLDVSNYGEVRYYFKIKYSDDSNEIGEINFEANHKCNRQWCPFEKYDLTFYASSISTYVYDLSIKQGGMEFTHTNLKKLDAIISACLRDLNVVEFETKDYSKKNVSLRPKNEQEKNKIWQKVVWVPRKKIIYNNVINEKINEFKNKVNEVIPLQVCGHLRSCKNPSKEQLELAHYYGLYPPEGFTFVRPHSRDIDMNYLNRFRSKSALMILYGENTDYERTNQLSSK